MGKTFENNMGSQIIIENFGKWVFKVAILISGRGSNMKNIIEACNNKNYVLL